MILVAWADDFLEDAAGLQMPGIVQGALAACLGRVSRTIGTPFAPLPAAAVSHFDDNDALDVPLGPAKACSGVSPLSLSPCCLRGARR